MLLTLSTMLLGDAHTIIQKGALRICDKVPISMAVTPEVQMAMFSHRTEFWPFVLYAE